MHNVTLFIRKRFTAPGGIDPRVGLLLLLIAAVVITGTALDTASEPAQLNAALTATAAPAPNQTATPGQDLTPQPTPLPEEYLNNQQQTIGLTLAAAALVLVVVIGVLAAFIQNPGDV